MKLTPSQEKAIEQTKKIFSNIYNNVQYTIYQPKNTDIVSLVAVYTIQSIMQTPIELSTSWTIGKRGKVNQTKYKGLVSRQ